MKISLKILSKKVEIEKNGKKKSFLRYFAPVKMLVKGKEEDGKVKKSLTVKFTENVELPKNARFFILTVDTAKNQISCPRVYEVKEKEDEDGNKVLEYPVIWIRGFEEINVLEAKSRPITDDVEFETEDTETEEHEITEDEKESDDLPFDND